MYRKVGAGGWGGGWVSSAAGLGDLGGWFGRDCAAFFAWSGFPAASERSGWLACACWGRAPSGFPSAWQSWSLRRKGCPEEVAAWVVVRPHWLGLQQTLNSFIAEKVHPIENIVVGRNCGWCGVDLNL